MFKYLFGPVFISSHFSLALRKRLFHPSYELTRYEAAEEPHEHYHITIGYFKSKASVEYYLYKTYHMTIKV